MWNCSNQKGNSYKNDDQMQKKKKPSKHGTFPEIDTKSEFLKNKKKIAVQ